MSSTPRHLSASRQAAMTASSSRLSIPCTCTPIEGVRAVVSITRISLPMNENRTLVGCESATGFTQSDCET